MRYAIKVGNETYPIMNSEVKKVVEAMATKSIVVLKSGIFRGSFISSIVRDIHAERGYNYHYRLTGADEVGLHDIETDLDEELKIQNPDIKLLN